VLPETAFPVRLETPDGRPYLDAARRHATRLGAPLLVGGFGVSPGAPARAYNSLFVIDSAGVTGRYDKRRLVPVIERTPLAGAWLLGVLRDTTSYAVGDAVRPLDVGGTRIAPLICFESAFAALVRAQRRQGATLLVNATNDAWFGSGLPGRAARAQHEAHLVLRALESGTPVVRVANGGRSGLVDPRGRPIWVAGAGEDGMMVVTVRAAGPPTPAVRIGGWVGPLAALAAGLMLVRGRGRSDRSTPHPPVATPVSPDPTG
jgi:apolipoprotein N-acyltransferase